MSSVSLDRIGQILERERIWSAYALADLDPPQDQHARWWVDQDAAVLSYAGFDPPVLFATGEVEQTRRLLAQVPQGRHLFTLRAEHRALLDARVQESHETPMWRMVLSSQPFHASASGGAQPLTARDLPSILDLFGEHPDRPDSFDAAQLGDGTFFGVWYGRQLITVAGTHVVSQVHRVAAVGNVFTHPAHRGRGLATIATAAVVQELLRRPGMETVVLNVAQANEPAVRCYERLGFRPFCAYHEGVGLLGPASRPPKEQKVP